MIEVRIVKRGEFTAPVLYSDGNEVGDVLAWDATQKGLALVLISGEKHMLATESVEFKTIRQILDTFSFSTTSERSSLPYRR